MINYRFVEIIYVNITVCSIMAPIWITGFFLFNTPM